MLMVLLYIYLSFGFIYAFYVTFWGGGRWYMFPINILGGPVVALTIIFKSLARKDFHV